MRCIECGRELDTRTEDVRYLHGGLENVHLIGVPVRVCTEGHREIVLPDPERLNKKLASLIVEKPAPLTGHEVRFLRKQLRFSARQFAALLGVTDVHVSRWETGARPVGDTSDRAIRLLYLCVSGAYGPEMQTKLLSVLPQINHGDISWQHRVRLTEAEDAVQWKYEPAASTVAADLVIVERGAEYVESVWPQARAAAERKTHFTIAAVENRGSDSHVSDEEHVKIGVA